MKINSLKICENQLSALYTKNIFGWLCGMQTGGTVYI